MIKRYKNKAIKRKTKIRAGLRRVTGRLRLSVFRSNKYIYAQIVDDQQGKTLAAASEKDLKKLKTKPACRQGRNEKLKTKIDKAKAIGEVLAKKALRKKIKKVYFDRGGYKYHGRIKALAQGARKGGLEF